MKLKEVIYNKIKSGKLSHFTERDIISSVCLHPKSNKERKAAKAALKELIKEGLLVLDIKRRLSTPEQLNAFKGIVRANPRGFAFITPDKGGSDFFVPASSLFGAYDGDRVLAAPVYGTHDEAYVLQILKRAGKKIVGTLEIAGNAGWVYSDDGKFPDIYIPLPLTMDAKNGDKVVCEVTAYPSNSSPAGKICEVLGEGGKLITEQLSIIRAHGLYAEFSEKAESEAQTSAEQPIDLNGRKDLRNLFTFTIDGADTRDIDDAVSLEFKDGKYILGVHIADVSNYVKFKSTLDDEAYARGTSVYFPDSVYPMLPKALSNGACSLNEGEERYALSCLMTFNPDGERENYEIFESVIKSDRRLTYDFVNEVSDGKEDEISHTVKLMKELCLKLESRRYLAGEVNLDVKEAKIYIENGEIIIPDYSRGIAERIIEQFMISANEAVAEFLRDSELPCLYRIHEKPAPEKCETLLSFVRDLGINARLDTENAKPKDFANILAAAENKPYSSVVNKVLLRSMQKARYAEKNEGHFGLASQCYCHFTSPIRRYPDLFVHRVLKMKLAGDGEKAKSLYGKNAARAGKDLSDRERNADECEREVDNLYKLFYMEKRIGECFDAVISGVTDFGIFCELKNTVEGMIPLEYLPDDIYEFYEEKFLLKGRRNRYKLGNQIKIRVENCDFGRLRVLFSPC